MWDLIISVPDHCLSFYFLYGNNGFNSPGKYFFYSTVSWSVKSGKNEKLNGLDKLQKILNKQAGQVKP